MSPFISERTPNSDDTATKNSSNDSKNDTTSDHIKHSDNSDKSSMKTRHMIDQLYTNSHDAIVSSPSSSSLFGYLDTERLSYAHDISSFNQHPPFIFQSNLTSSIQNSHLHGNRLINQDPFIKQQEDLHDVNDFILPSSLNDLLTPNELQHRQQYNSAASSYVLNGSGHSYEMTHASWNIPFYANNHGHANPLGNYDNRHYESVNDIDILSEIEMNTTMNKELGHLMDYAADEGPFVMEDTSLESNLASENPENYAFIHHLISIQK
ncbi:hypothetical protein BDB01DRAFT_782195 [Pilobolus umbonatus]|nr:hypothetical protein BDB01DRAFT_782195 [Pilobolus umbonatus]